MRGQRVEDLGLVNVLAVSGVRHADLQRKRLLALHVVHDVHFLCGISLGIRTKSGFVYLL